MEFLQPLALFGLAAATVPALLHLLQRREPPTLPFPAVRYLIEADERDSRRLRLRNLLLLLLRTALIAVLALAAARPVVPAAFGGAHAPSAVVVILDNSLSSGAVAAGRPRLATLLDAARTIGGRATAADRLWRITADGIPQRLTPTEWSDALDQLRPSARRLDLGVATRTAATLLRSEDLPGAVVVLSDLQASALSRVEPDVPVVALEPAPAPANRGVARARVSPETWSAGGTVSAELGGNEAGPGEVTLTVAGAPVARGLAAAGAGVALSVEGVTPGWHEAALELAPDELRSDDVFHLAVRGATPAAVATDGAGTFVDAALEALAAAGRVRAGRAVVIGDRAASDATVILPPADPARVAAANQALAARGLRVRFGSLERGEWAATSDLLPLQDVTVRQRYRLAGADGEEGAALALAGGEPWLVRDGEAVVLASRIEEAWTDLPLRPAFIPFLDALVNRVSAGEAWQIVAAPGDVVRLPGTARQLLLPRGAMAVAPGVPIDAPVDPGTFFLTDAAGDTVGALLVNPDPRESDLRVASRAAIRDQLAAGVVTPDPERLAAAAFAARRAELTTGLLLLALALAVVELVLATVGSGSRRRGVA